MRSRAVLVGLATSLGCSPGAPVVHETAIDATVPSPSSVRDDERPGIAPKPPPSMRDLATIALPAKEVCTLSSPLKGTIPVTVKAEAPPFGIVKEAQSLTVHIADGEPYAGIVVEAETKSVFVRAIAEASSIDLHATRVSVFGGMVMPMASANLTLARGKAEGLDLTLALPTSVELEGRPTTAEGTLPCSVVSLGQDPFDPFETYFGVPTGYARLRGARIPISIGSGDKPVGTLAPGADDARDVYVLGREKLKTKIVWSVGDVMAFGWVDTARLELDTEKPGQGASIGLGNIGTSGGCCQHIFVCRQEVPFGAEGGGVTETVGVVAPGVKIRVYWTDKGVHHAHISEGGFESRGSSLLFDPERVRGCHDLVDQKSRRRAP